MASFYRKQANNDLPQQEIAKNMSEKKTPPDMSNPGLAELAGYTICKKEESLLSAAAGLDDE
jgi:hypothetical protein